MNKKSFHRIALGFSVIAMAVPPLAFGDGRPGQDTGWEQHVNAQTGTSYTYATGDFGKLVTFSNAASIAATLPQCPSAGFHTGFHFDTMNTGAGTLTITPTTSTIDGIATLVLTTGSGAHVVCDGTNWNTWHSGSAGGGSDGAWIQAGSPAGTLLNSWTNVSARELSYEKDRMGFVHLRGAIVPGTTTSGTAVVNLPAGFRPLSVQDFIVPAYAGSSSFQWAWISIQTTGDVQFILGNCANGSGSCTIIAPTVEVSLAGLSFPTN